MYIPTTPGEEDVQKNRLGFKINIKLDMQSGMKKCLFRKKVKDCKHFLNIVKMPLHFVPCPKFSVSSIRGYEDSKYSIYFM